MFNVKLTMVQIVNLELRIKSIYTVIITKSSYLITFLYKTIVMGIIVLLYL